MGEVKLTKAQRRALEWFSERPEGAQLFGRGDPSLTFVRQLCKAGLVDRIPPPSPGFSRYVLSSAGRAALTKEGERG
jgi:hypothetical protein